MGAALLASLPWRDGSVVAVVAGSVIMTRNVCGPNNSVSGF